MDQYVGIEIKMRVPIVVSKKDKWVVASCPALDVVSQGADEKEARSNLLEAMTLFLESCLERGTLDQVLKNCGFTPSQSKPIEDESESMEVPLYMLAHHGESHQCRHA